MADSLSDYENLNGEYDAPVMRAYIRGGNIPSPGMVLHLIEEVEMRESCLEMRDIEIARLTALVAELRNPMERFRAAYFDGLELREETIRPFIREFGAVLDKLKERETHDGGA